MFSDKACSPCAATLDPGRYWLVMHTGIFRDPAE
jgi:hypothetical protein